MYYLVCIDLKIENPWTLPEALERNIFSFCARGFLEPHVLADYCTQENQKGEGDHAFLVITICGAGHVVHPDRQHKPPEEEARGKRDFSGKRQDDRCDKGENKENQCTHFRHILSGC